MLLIDKPMPETCEKCPCYDEEFNYCNVLEKAVDKDIWWDSVRRRMDDCPLRETKAQMDNLISRQAAIDALMVWEEGSIWDEECLKHRGEPYLVAPSDVIADLPSAQPEIMRCKDCAKRKYCRTSTVWAVAPGDDWYCADGKKMN